MSKDMMAELAAELLRKSQSGKLDWETTPFNDLYQLVFPDGRITLSLEMGIRISLRLYGQDGVSLAGQLSAKPDGPHYEQLMEIFETARERLGREAVSKALAFLNSR